MKRQQFSIYTYLLIKSIQQRYIFCIFNPVQLLVELLFDSVNKSNSKKKYILKKRAIFLAEMIDAFSELYSIDPKAVKEIELYDFEFIFLNSIYYPDKI